MNEGQTCAGRARTVGWVGRYRTNQSEVSQFSISQDLELHDFVLGAMRLLLQQRLEAGKVIRSGKQSRAFSCKLVRS